MIKSVASVVSTSVGNSVVGWADRSARQARLRRARRVDLLLALLTTRLSTLAYEESQSKVASALRTPAYADVPGGLHLVHFRRQRPEKSNGETTTEVHPQWFLARGELPAWAAECDASPAKRRKRSRRKADDDADGSDADNGCGSGKGGAWFLVFRGTWSTNDIIRDLCVEPEEVFVDGTRCGFHGGFLKGVRDDPELHAALARAVRRGCDHLFICGHSLGGSLALTLASANMLPAGYTGRVTVVGVGSPPVSLRDTEVMPRAADGDRDGDRAKSSPPPPPPPPPPAERSGHEPRYLLIVNERDVVPRLLGSPMPVATATLLAQAVASGGATSQAVMRRNVELMETMQAYSHPPTTRLVLLRDGAAKAVPASERGAVLHLHEALSPQLLDDHSCERYVRGLEVAAALAEAYDDEVEVV